MYSRVHVLAKSDLCIRRNVGDCMVKMCVIFTVVDVVASSEVVLLINSFFVHLI